MSSFPKPSAVIFAKDVQKLVSFYSTVLAMPIKFSDDKHVVLDGPAMQLVIHAIPADIAARITISTPPAIRHEVPIVICMPVVSLQHARQVAITHGGQLYGEDKCWNGPSFRACSGYDPEGNVFQLREALDTSATA